MSPRELIFYLEVAGADVADIIPVVDILGSCRQKSLEVLHAGHSAVLPLELVSGKRTLDLNKICTGGRQFESHLELSAAVGNINSFLDSQVTPHRHLQLQKVQTTNRKHEDFSNWPPQ